MHTIDISIDGRRFRFTLEALGALNKVLARMDVNPLKEDYKNGEYQYIEKPDGKRKIEVQLTTNWVEESEVVAG